VVPGHPEQKRASACDGGGVSCIEQVAVPVAIQVLAAVSIDLSMEAFSPRSQSASRNSGLVDILRAPVVQDPFE
jgi:hypothetical protein